MILFVPMANGDSHSVHSALPIRTGGLPSPALISGSAASGRTADTEAVTRAAVIPAVAILGSPEPVTPMALRRVALDMGTAVMTSDMVGIVSRFRPKQVHSIPIRPVRELPTPSHPTTTVITRSIATEQKLFSKQSFSQT